MAKTPHERLAHLHVLIARNETKMKRTLTALDKYRRERRRLIMKIGHPANIESAMLHGKTQTMGVVYPTAEPVRELQKPSLPVSDPSPTVSDNLDIPGFLRRSPEDKAAAEKIEAEQAAIKKAKAQGRIAKMKAKKAGETSKMPLTGKAAMALINNG